MHIYIWERDLKELAHIILGSANSKLASTGLERGEPVKSWCFSPKKGSIEAEFLPLGRPQSFFLRPLADWKKPIHIIERKIYFTQSLMIWMLITSIKNTFTATRLGFDQLSGNTA